MNASKTLPTSLALLALALIGWQAQAQDPLHPVPRPVMQMRAVAVLQPTAGSQAKGRVTFETSAVGVRVQAEISGLAPNSVHGFHIHEFGDLRSEDGSSLGGHYNPAGHMHALPESEVRHAGDLGNLTANADGVAKLDHVFDSFSIDGPKAPILGRGVVVHALPDDGGQPVGNAGGRIGVGVIGVAGK